MCVGGGGVEVAAIGTTVYMELHHASPNMSHRFTATLRLERKP